MVQLVSGSPLNTRALPSDPHASYTHRNVKVCQYCINVLKLCGFTQVSLSLGIFLPMFKYVGLKTFFFVLHKGVV